MVPDQGFVMAVFLLALRLSTMFLLTPILHAFSVPASARLLLVIGLAVGLALGIPATDTREMLTMTSAELFTSCLKELALGATLALTILTAFAAISMAGRLMDVQIGFGIAQVFDPVTQRQIPVLSSAFDKLGVIVFFMIDGHHALLRGIAYSLERFPLGRTWPVEAAAPFVIKQFAGLFGLGLALAAPVVVCLLMVELALGVVARNLPQMNTVLIGLALFLTLFTMSPVLQELNQDTLQPFMAGKLGMEEAYVKGSGPMRGFMVRQTREQDLALMVELSKAPRPESMADISNVQLVPAFMLSELRAAFQIGFVVFLPFLLIDLIVSSVLMALGMMMMPPTTVALPLKILMFILVDGWSLVLKALVGSFH